MPEAGCVGRRCGVRCACADDAATGAFRRRRRRAFPCSLPPAPLHGRGRTQQTRTGVGCGVCSRATERHRGQARGGGAYGGRGNGARRRAPRGRARRAERPRRARRIRRYPYNRTRARRGGVRGAGGRGGEAAGRWPRGGGVRRGGGACRAGLPNKLLHIPCGAAHRRGMSSRIWVRGGRACACCP